jgi:hypothetical protein
VKKVTQVVTLDEALADMQSRASNNGYFSFSWIPHVNKAQLVIVNETKEKIAEGKENSRKILKIASAANFQVKAVQYLHSNGFALYHTALFTVTGFVEVLTPYLLGFYSNSLKVTRYHKVNNLLSDKKLS